MTQILLGIGILVVGVLLLGEGWSKLPSIKSSKAVITKPEKPSLPLRSEDHDILTKAGWLDFVQQNLDGVVYFPYQGLTDDKGSTYIGQTRLVDGKYVAYVSSLQTVIGVSQTLVHEATHSKGRREYGDWASENDAKEAELKFEQDYKANLLSR